MIAHFTMIAHFIFDDSQSNGPKGRDISAQGNALGIVTQERQRPEWPR
jgi:hypothetical protein